MSSRKYESGFQKRKKQKRIEGLIQSQKGAMDRFVIKESQVSPVNQPADGGPAIVVLLLTTRLRMFLLITQT
jgi:hypothetical protein